MRPMMARLAAAVLLLAPAAWADEPAIGTLRTRDHDVRIIAGEPPRYTVTDRQGNVVADSVTRDEIARRLPEVHRALEKGIAGAQDARLR